jgi:hypothetical protein
MDDAGKLHRGRIERRPYNDRRGCPRAGCEYTGKE